MNILALFLLLSFPVASFTPPAPPLAALTVYSGSWNVIPAGKPDAAAKPDHLVNHCTMNDAFYTCEQVVNGKSVALVVFVAGDKPGIYATQAIMPNGHAAGGSQLTVAGPHWTFLSSDDAGKPTFRVENVFTGTDRIHSEQFKAEADGSWTKVGEQTTVRATGQ